mmetsp:Transcript_6760/g.23290  ORF Transcript_6760/g.23290 Transcript_6760/m.23290 type:complete len:365 (-) Transcript_6760:54-1148(-)
MDELESRASEGLDRVRLLLSSSNAPKWANYVFGAFVAYCRDVAKRYPQESLTVTVDSDVPLGEGVSSSASVEVAVCRALRDYYYEGEGVDYDDDEDPLRVARVCQSAENEVCGAPCGIMDQIACLLGQHGQLLPIDCGTVATLPPAYLPEDALVVGFPTKVRHHHAGANTPYQRARTATAMGCKIAMGVVPEIRSLADVSRLVTPWVYERHVRGLLPETLGGRKFLDDHGDVAEVDALSQVDPEEDYPVGACLEFASKATFYANLALSLLEGAAFSDAESRHRVLTRVGELMLLQNESYNKMGLGHCVTDTIIDLLMSFGPKAGIYGARASGGGSGGTICVLCNEEALPVLEGIAAEYKTTLIL